MESRGKAGKVGVAAAARGTTRTRIGARGKRMSKRRKRTGGRRETGSRRTIGRGDGKVNIDCRRGDGKSPPFANCAKSRAPSSSNDRDLLLIGEDSPLPQAGSE